jgi:hypothetical protein
MGLVRFGQTTLNIENVPDGSVIVAQTELTQLQNANNSYLSLKSKIPVGVSEDQISSLVERGQRFEEVNGKLSETTKKVTELSGQVESFKNMPQDFSVDKWKADRQREINEVRAKKMDALTTAAYERVTKETGAKIVVDPRFISAEAMASFNPDAPDAAQKWYDILDAAHTESQKFIADNLGSAQPIPGQVGAGGPPPVHPLQRDVVTADKARLGHF